MELKKWGARLALMAYVASPTVGAKFGDYMSSIAEAKSRYEIVEGGLGGVDIGEKKGGVMSESSAEITVLTGDSILERKINSKTPEIMSKDKRHNGGAFHLEDWDLLHGRLSYDDIPEYAGNEPEIFGIGTPRKSRLAIRLEEVVKNKVYKEIRRLLKKPLKEMYEESNMSYSEYRERLGRIDNIGSEPRVRDDIGFGYTNNEVKEDLFHDRYIDGESEIPILSIGDFTIMDSGSIRYVPSHEKGKDFVEEFVVGENKEIRNKPFVASKDFNIDPGFQISLGGKDIIRSYGFSIGIEKLSDVLALPQGSLEIEVKIDNLDDFAGAYFNFVLKSRK
jgi:hypothetical protein